MWLLRRKLIIMICVGILAVVSAVCLPFNELVSGTTSTPPVVIKAAVPAFDRDRNTPIDKEFERRTNLTFDWLQFPVNEYIKRINQMLTSAGQKPDIFIINKDMVQRFGPMGMLLDLRPYLDQMPNLKRWIEGYPQIVEDMMTEDGKLYGIDGLNTYGQMPIGYIFREDIFYRNGMLLPKTFDELYDSLKILKQIYPDSKPISNRSGPANLFEQFYMAYHTQGGIYFDSQKMVYKFGPTEPNFKKAVMMARKFYEADLIDPDFATVSDPQFFENVIGGKTFALFGEYFIEMDGWKEQGRKRDSFYSLKAVLPLVTDNGLQALQPVQYPNSRGTWVIAINAKSPHIKELIALLDAQYSEEIVELTNWGIEGDTFNRVNGEHRYTSRLQTKLNPYGEVTPQEMGVDGRSGICVPYDQDAEYARKWGAAGLESQQLYTANADKIGFFAGPSISFSQEELIEITKIMSPIKNFVTLKVIQFVTGELGMGKDWDDFQDELAKMGAGNVLKLYQEKYAKLPNERKVIYKSIR
ncbi:extracellular solute-binding protein [Paenibacillus sp. KQZ6P-2]|uniref:Extracellular solute-binding protein n=1 Tax=Paenibacillus mangrovi TaxID=2931978 RepID=A0A9X1WMR2_9BACL|nr:extracellular solute-binding protein [Paenibacillus mangrovi]MCJ8011481.1 extracellular solute-binding protein [Paenibacillus mangrovi]